MKSVVLSLIVQLFFLNVASAANFVCPTADNFQNKRLTKKRMYSALKPGSAWSRNKYGDSDSGMGILSIEDLVNVNRKYDVFGLKIPAVQDILNSYNETESGIFKIFYFWDNPPEEKSSRSATECARQIVITGNNGRGKGHFEGYLYVDICNPGILLGTLGKGPLPAKLTKAGVPTDTITHDSLPYLNELMKVRSSVTGYKELNGKKIFRAKAKIEDIHFAEKDSEYCVMNIEMDPQVDGFAGIADSYTFYNLYRKTYEYPTYFWNSKGKREQSNLIYSNEINKR